MPRFSYSAIDGNHKSTKGTLTAENPFAARKQLRGKGLHPTAIRELSAEEHSGFWTRLLGRNRKVLVADFTRQLSTMLGAGIKLTDALSVLVQQQTDARFKSALNDIRDRVVTGESFADAMAEYRDFFDIIFISMIRVGEVTGTLSQSLETMATFIDKKRRVEAKMTTAMIYPCILLVGCIGVVIFMSIKVIPPIAKQLEQNRQTLPLITRVLVKTGDILSSYWVFSILAVLGASWWGMHKILQTKRGARIRDKILLGLPMFGPLLKQRIVARFTSSLSTLLRSGMNMADSLKVVAEVTGNTIMNLAVRQARERILSGADIATPLRDSGVIDPTIAHMVTVGEKSGELEKMLRNISDTLEAQSDIVIERLSAVMETCIIIMLAVVIGTVTYAVLMPLIKFSAGQF
jgi:type II secretory pathway component PulF